jgi:hypothetical protein
MVAVVKHSLVMSTCLSNGIQAWSLEKSTPAAQATWSNTAICVLDTRLNCTSTIVHLIPGEQQADKFIISTHKSGHLWNLTTGSEETLMVYDHDALRAWLQHPRS